MARIDDIYKSNSNFLRVEDLQKRKVSVTVEAASVEKVGDDRKIVLHFEGKEKGLALNKTNARMMEFLTGYDDSDSWIGYRITLKPDITDYQGKSTPCIRIDSELPEQPQRRAAPPPPKQEFQGDSSDIPF